MSSIFTITQRKSSFKAIIAVATVFTGVSTVRATLIASNWIGGNSNWNTPSNWSNVPGFAGAPNNGGGNTFDALVGAGSATITSATELNSLTINNSAKVLVTSAGHENIHVGNLSINNVSSGATLDLNSWCMIVDNETDATIFNYLSTGFNQPTGYWDGPGISSSQAASDSLSGLPTSLAYAKAGDLGYTSWANIPVAPSSIIIRYTYIGDANLDGKVDPTDYALYSNGFANSLSGWINGDFNYDNVIDATDLAMLDFANSTQGAPIPDVHLPEPTSLGFGLVCAFTILRRNRRG